MPKMKTNRGAAKRFKRTASGAYKFRRGFRSHILTKKSAKQKRHLRSPAAIHDHDAAAVRQLLPYSS